MERRGRHLDGGERAVIFAEHRRGTSQREIARGWVLLGSGSGSRSGHCPQAGQNAYARRRRRCRPRRKLVPGGVLWRFVWHRLVKFRWSALGRSPRHCGPCTPMIQRPA